MKSLHLSGKLAFLTTFVLLSPTGALRVQSNLAFSPSLLISKNSHALALSSVQGRRVVTLLRDSKDGRKFDNLNDRANKLSEEAKKYENSDVSDLAEGLQDDVTAFKSKLQEAQKKAGDRKSKGFLTAGAAALLVGLAAWAFGPRRAGAEMKTFAFNNAPQQETLVGPTLPDDTFISASKWEGAKKGFVFKTGPKGLGYYLDTGLSLEELGGKSGGFHIPTPVTVAVGVVGLGVTGKFLLKNRGTLTLAAMAAKAAMKARSASSPMNVGGTAGGAASAAAAGASAGAKAAEAYQTAAASAETFAGKDPATMKAAELKKAIQELGGNPSGLVEKSELVALFRELQSSPRTVTTRKYNPAEEDMSSAAAAADFDPTKVDQSALNDMMGNPMIQALSKQMMNDPETMREFQEAMSSGKGMNELMSSPKFQKMTENLMSNPEVMRMMQDPSEINKMMDQMKKMGVNPPRGF
uniref:STI1 domain-containing protein n=1 Tax=Guillardia theta TaxID=55529 RepID=A0A7S4KUM5_GUITH